MWCGCLVEPISGPGHPRDRRRRAGPYLISAVQRGLSSMVVRERLLRRQMLDELEQRGGEPSVWLQAHASGMLADTLAESSDSDSEEDELPVLLSSRRLSSLGQSGRGGAQPA